MVPPRPRSLSPPPAAPEPMVEPVPAPEQVPEEETALEWEPAEGVAPWWERFMTSEDDLQAGYTNGQTPAQTSEPLPSAPKPRSTYPRFVFRTSMTTLSAAGSRRRSSLSSLFRRKPSEPEGPVIKVIAATDSEVVEPGPLRERWRARQSRDFLMSEYD